MTVDTARLALLLYVAALLVLVAGDRKGGHLARALWTAGVAAFLAHVVAAFHLVHGWSHAAAVAETARQTRELFDINSGFGLWFNYLFTIVWLADATWWWIDEPGYRDRSAWVSGAVHGFIGFMFFNGAVVFARGPSRWIGLAATVLLPLVWMRSRRRGIGPGESAP